MTSHIMCLQFSICKVKLLKRDSLIIIKLCLCQLPRSRDKCVKTYVANIAFFRLKKSHLVLVLVSYQFREFFIFSDVTGIFLGVELSHIG